jgi:hypothetical protein
LASIMLVQRPDYRQAARPQVRAPRPEEPRAWFARFEAPAGADGKRRQLRVGPYATEREAQAAVVEALGKISDGKHVADLKTTLAEYLDRWLEWTRAR